MLKISINAEIFKKIEFLNKANKPGRCLCLVNARQTLNLDLLFRVICYCSHRALTNLLALKWKKQNRKTSLDRGKETNKPKEGS